MKKLFYILFFLLGILIDGVCFADFGGVEFIGTGNTVIRATAQKDSSATTLAAVGRSWTGSQYKALLASFTNEGGQDLNFAIGNGSYFGKNLYDFSGAGLDNLCSAVVYAFDGYIAACRSMKANGYYNIYLVKFNIYGALDTSFGTGGIFETALGGNSTDGHALPRGIAYSPNGGTNGVVAVVGAIGKYTSTFTPFIARYNQATGALIGGLVGGLNAGIAGTATAIYFDSGALKYYVASTESTGNRSFYVDQLTEGLVVNGSFGNAIALTGAGGGLDSVPSSLVKIGTNIIAVGGTRTNSSTPP
jgi:hypothetical protein